MDEAVTLLRARTRNHKLSIQLGTDILASKTIILLKTDDEALTGFKTLCRLEGILQAEIRRGPQLHRFYDCFLGEETFHP